MTKQENLLVIFFLKKFCHYLLGYKAKFVINHKALTYLVNNLIQMVDLFNGCY